MPAVPLSESPLSQLPLFEPSLSLLDAHLEACGLVDRVSALQQVLGSLQGSQEGSLQKLLQKRVSHTLILGEQGIGKTALLNSALHYLNTAPMPTLAGQKGLWVVRIPLSATAFQSPLALLQAVVAGWQHTAHQRLAQGLNDANALLEPLGLHWGQEELIRAVTLMRLQWDMDQLGSAVDLLPRQRLANAIRSAMPFSKRVHFSSVNLGVKQLVERLTDPWLAVAVQWVQPVVPEIVEALSLIAPSEVTPPEVIPPEVIQALESEEQEPYLVAETPRVEASSLRWVDNAQDTVMAALHWVTTQYKPSSSSAATTPAVTTASPVPVVVALDGLEALAQLPMAQRQAVQQVLQHLLEHSGHTWWLTCNSQALSQAVAGPLLKQCHPLVTLEPLSLRQQRRWFTQALSQHQLGWEDSAVERLALSTKGNPFWLGVASQLVVERLKATDTSTCTLAWVIALGIEEPQDWLETAWARVLMTLQPLQATLDEGARWEPLQAVADVLEYTALLLENEAWKESEWLAAAVGHDSLKRRLAVGAMAALAQFGFVEINFVDIKGRPYPESRPHEETTYRWGSDAHRQFLLEKTRWVRADLPNDAKLAYLQKIIPLSAQAGELDGPRVAELLALGGQSMEPSDLDSLMQTLQTVLLQASQHSQPTQRLMALEGLFQLATPVALNVLQQAFKDPSSVVREYALRYWTLLASRPLPDVLSAQVIQAVLTSLTPCLDDSDVSVRWWAYKLASTMTGIARSVALPQAIPSLLTVFLKGAFDQSPRVRQLAVQQLGQADAHSAQVRQTLLTLAQTDAEDAIRYEACKSLQCQPHPKVLEALLGVLEHDANSRNRSLAVQLLSQYHNPLIAETFRNALVAGDDGFSEEVRLTLIRALRVFPSAATEAALQALFKQPNLPAQVSWAIIRTLHEIATTPQTLALLKEYFTKTQDATLKMACLSASQLITERLNLASQPLETLAVQGDVIHV